MKAFVEKSKLLAFAMSILTIVLAVVTFRSAGPIWAIAAGLLIAYNAIIALNTAFQFIWDKVKAWPIFKPLLKRKKVNAAKAVAKEKAEAYAKAQRATRKARRAREAAEAAACANPSDTALAAALATAQTEETNAANAEAMAKRASEDANDDLEEAKEA